MIKADTYLKETISSILEKGEWDTNPRAKWSDGTPAKSKYITQKVFEYDISRGEFPINTLRTTALKGSFHDIEAIYIKQTNIIEEMHPSIHSWWKDFSKIYKEKQIIKRLLKNNNEKSTIGKTYGHTVKKYSLMDSLLKNLEENPFSRRHIIDMWQEQQMIEDPQALPPCAYSTLWSVREVEKLKRSVRYIDVTLIQRSQDFIVTSSINSAQYTMLAMMVANHLTYKTGIKHSVGKLLHIVQNCHIYDRHLDVAKEILNIKPTRFQPRISLTCYPKNFYSHKVDDFKFTNLENIKPLTEKLEIAI